jgi:diguanylate cyclase (GGDEF)-like protein/PAS domain S-box-containing protein
MSKKPSKQDSLRTNTETQLAHTPSMEASVRPADEPKNELHALQVKLEMQNEKLRRAHIALEESRDRYVNLYEFASVGYLTLTREGLIAGINLTGATLLRVERKKLINRRFAALVAPKDSDRWHRLFMGVVRHEKEGHDFELILQRGDNSVFYAQLNCSWRLTTSCVPIIRIALTDITDRKCAEEELRIAAVAFQAQEGMVITDAEQTILRVNRAFTEITGYSAEEIIGQTPRILRSGRHDEAFYAEMWENIKRAGAWQGEIWGRRKNGDLYSQWLTITAVKGADGAVAHYVSTHTDITVRKAAEEEILNMAYYDPLTQLPNRRMLHDRLNQAFASSQRSGQYGAIMFMDLDHFKMLNDAHGHDFGDLLLIEVAHRLVDTVREGDTVVRLGGDEFVVLLEDLGEEIQEAAIQAGLVADKVHKAIADRPYSLKDYLHHCTVSIGITSFRSHDMPVDKLFKQADLAMYQAKTSGRNRLRFFDPVMQTALDERSALAADLRHASMRGELQLHYQPQINNLRHVIGAEALLRWTHPERGLVSPSIFIPIAEETGSIIPIGLWILETVCTQLKDWEADLRTRNLYIAINVSARQFRQTNFVEQIREVVKRTTINPTRLKIELTESLVLENVADTIEKMLALKALGIGFSMDDFGTGYSSLAYITQLPLDQLKIDQSFVRNILTKPTDTMIAQTIISMAHILGLNVIAEGVETEQQIDFLERNGCLVYQGYLFGKPMPIDTFHGRLKINPSDCP